VATSAAPKKRPSKLAKEHSLTAAQEAEINEAFNLFATPSQEPGHKDNKSNSKTGTTSVIRTADVRRCLIALNTPPSTPAELAEILATLDPTDTGVVQHEHFFAVAALKLHAHAHEREQHHNDEDADGDDENGAGMGDEEVEAAFRLFTRGEGEVITLAHLRRVAGELREEVGDATLKDMMREARGDRNDRGVSLEEFEGVMRRAGVFG